MLRHSYKVVLVLLLAPLLLAPSVLNNTSRREVGECPFPTTPEIFDDFSTNGCQGDRGGINEGDGRWTCSSKASGGIAYNRINDGTGGQHTTSAGGNFSSVHNTPTASSTQVILAETDNWTQSGYFCSLGLRWGGSYESGNRPDSDFVHVRWNHNVSRWQSARSFLETDNMIANGFTVLGNWPSNEGAGPQNGWYVGIRVSGTDPSTTVKIYIFNAKPQTDWDPNDPACSDAAWDSDPAWQWSAQLTNNYNLGASAANQVVISKFSGSNLCRLNEISVWSE